MPPWSTAGSDEFEINTDKWLSSERLPKMRILFCGRIFAEAPEFLARALPSDEIISCDSRELASMSRNADILIPLMTPVTADIIESGEVKLIQQWGVGLEGVDIDCASRKGVSVCNVPGDVTLNADSTAEHAVFLMMALARRMNEFEACFRSNAWGSPTGLALSGTTALIVGLGRVGRSLAKKLKALGMIVHAINRSGKILEGDEPYIDNIGGTSELYAMSGEADFVISCASLNEHTRSLFNDRLFSSMKASGFVVNVSRGPIIAEEELVEALAAGKIAGAGLDVFATEPFAVNPVLSASPKVVASPHIAGVTSQNYRGICSVVADNICRLKESRPLLYCVNAGKMSKS